MIQWTVLVFAGIEVLFAAETTLAIFCEAGIRGIAETWLRPRIDLAENFKSHCKAFTGFQLQSHLGMESNQKINRITPGTLWKAQSTLGRHQPCMGEILFFHLSAASRADPF